MGVGVGVGVFVCVCVCVCVRVFVCVYCMCAQVRECARACAKLSFSLPTRTRMRTSNVETHKTIPAGFSSCLVSTFYTLTEGARPVMDTQGRGDESVVLAP